MSTTHLSQIERGQASPTIGVLAKIARALGKSSSYFVEMDERPEVSQQRQAARVRFEPSPRVTCETLTSGTPGSRIWAYRLSFAGRSAELELAAGAMAGEALYLVTRGALEADFGFGAVRLDVGDAVQASFARCHRLVAGNDETTEALAVLMDARIRQLEASEIGPQGLILDRDQDPASGDSWEGPTCEVSLGLGRQIKRARASLGLTLKDIQERGGISATHVSEIERGRTSPTVVALGRIAQALGLPAAVMVDHPTAPEVSVASREQRGGRTVRWGTATLEPLTEPLKDDELGVHVLRLPVDEAPSLSHRHEGEEWLTLLSGIAEVRVEDSRYLLLEGDSLHFRADHLHSYSNPASTPATLLVACRPRIRL